MCEIIEKAIENEGEKSEKYDILFISAARVSALLSGTVTLVPGIRQAPAVLPIKPCARQNTPRH